jgi:AcrR family transcriptional regulator
MALSKGQQARQTIIESAYPLFVEQGFHATSMRQIARNAGVAVGGIYNHFPGKEDIFRAVLLAFHPYHEILPALRDAPSQSAREFMQAAAGQMVEFLELRPGYLNLFFIELVEFEGRHMQLIYQQIMPELDIILERFSAWSHYLRPLPTPLLFRAFMGLFFSYVFSERIMGDFVMPELRGSHALDALLDIFLHGVLAGESHD